MYFVIFNFQCWPHVTKMFSILNLAPKKFCRAKIDRHLESISPWIWWKTEMFHKWRLTCDQITIDLNVICGPFRGVKIHQISQTKRWTFCCHTKWQRFFKKNRYLTLHNFVQPTLQCTILKNSFLFGFVWVCFSF